jgi:hypothetical protein
MSAPDFVYLVEEVAAKIAAGGKIFRGPGKVQTKHSCLAQVVEAADAQCVVHPIQCPCGQWLLCPRCLS